MPPGVLQTALAKHGLFRGQVNISEDDRDLIWTLSSKGLLNRLLYHKAKVTLLPILIHFWKRYLSPPSEVAEAVRVPASFFSHLAPLA